MILVTGGTGFLGGYLVPALLAQGHRVRLLARSPQKVRLASQELLEVVEGDITDIVMLERAFEGISRVIHGAAVVSFWKKRRPEMERINVGGTANLVDVSLQANIEQFIHISSIAALGRSADSSLMDENTKWKDSDLNSYYAITKYKAEKEIYRGIAEGMKAVILNPGVIMGAGDPQTTGWDAGTPKLIKTVAEGLKFYNKGGSGFVGVEDVSRAIIAVLEANLGAGEKFVLVSENRSYQELLTEVAEKLGVPPPTRSVFPALGTLAGTLAEFISGITGKEPLLTRETGRFSAFVSEYDGSRITRELDFQYDPLSEVLQQTTQTYLAHHGNSGQRK